YYGFFEHRQHTRVVGGDPVDERVVPAPVVEHLEVVAGQVSGVVSDDPVDLVLFGCGRERDPRREQLLDGVIATGAGEDEHDRGEQPGPVEPVDDGDPRGRAHERGAVAALLSLPASGM